MPKRIKAALICAVLTFGSTSILLADFGDSFNDWLGEPWKVTRIRYGTDDVCCGMQVKNEFTITRDGTKTRPIYPLQGKEAKTLQAIRAHWRGTNSRSSGASCWLTTESLNPNQVWLNNSR
jgi:hypothetical protein